MDSKKITSRQAQAIKTRNKIYKIAFDLMKQKGFDNITIEDISKKAGVSVGTFYHYFKSKNDILFEIYHRADEYFNDKVLNKLKSDNSLEQIVEFFNHYGEYSKLTGIDFTKQLYNTGNKFFIKKDRDMLNILKDIIKYGQDRGEISNNAEAEEIMEYLFIGARGVVFDWCLYDGHYDLPVRMSLFFNDFVKSIASK